MRYRVLGPLQVHADEGEFITPKGSKQRLLLAALLLHAPRVVSVDRLIDLLWDREIPANPTAALHIQISRLRNFLRGVGAGDPIESEAYGYRLRAAPEDVDTRSFEAIVAEARLAPTPALALEALDHALALWRGDPFEEFADRQQFLGEVTRLNEVHATARERRVEHLLELGRTDEALVACEPLILSEPLREKPRALMMEGLYRSGRQADALDAFQRYRRLLSEELGLEPSPSLRQLQMEILRHERPPAPSESVIHPPGGVGSAMLPLPIRVAFAERHDGARLAYGETGDGPPLLVLPAWVSSLSAMRAGIDPRPRCAFFASLSERARLILYDRYGMGLSAGRVDRLSLDSDVEEIRLVMDAAGLESASLLAVSQAGPPALAFAARHPGRVSHRVLFGTYACAARTFPREDVRASMIALVRAHWGIGSKALADLIVPGASAEEATNFARVQREAATPELAAAALEQFFAVDVTELLPSVTCPALVIHYTRDRAIPFRGGEEIAALLPDARLIPLSSPAPAHLPRREDLPHLTDLIAEFLTSPASSAPLPPQRPPKAT